MGNGRSPGADTPRNGAGVGIRDDTQRTPAPRSRTSEPPAWVIPGFGLEGTQWTIVSPPFRKQELTWRRWWVTLECSCGKHVDMWVNDLRKPYVLPTRCRDCWRKLPREEKRNLRMRREAFRNKRPRTYKRVISRREQRQKGMGWPDPVLVDNRESVRPISAQKLEDSHE